MKEMIVLSAAFLIFSGSVRAQSQYELNEQEAAKTAKLEKDVKKAIATLEAKEKSNQQFEHRLEDSQTKWNKFVDAHVDSIFPLGPNEDYHNQYGSIYPMCWAVCRGEMAQNRLDELSNWHKLPKSGSKTGASKEYEKADKELNLIYKKVLYSKAKELPYFTSKMMETEKAWIAFRDADADAYASSNKEQKAHTSKLTLLIRERINQLNKWLTGVQEGDCCAGSYPIN